MDTPALGRGVRSQLAAADGAAGEGGEEGDEKWKTSGERQRVLRTRCRYTGTVGTRVVNVLLYFPLVVARLHRRSGAFQRTGVHMQAPFCTVHVINILLPALS